MLKYKTIELYEGIQIELVPKEKYQYGFKDYVFDFIDCQFLGSNFIRDVGSIDGNKEYTIYKAL